MNELIEYINQYATLLKEGSVWHNSKELLAPVVIDSNQIAMDSYIYEFYCYISIIVDLMPNYEIIFHEGTGKNKYKFPQAAADKKGKPRFHALKNDEIQFQICAGTKIKCRFKSEENHPDISFQIATASDDPKEGDLILIMDAKYKENIDSSLPKEEIYKFAEIVRLFGLCKRPIKEIEFDIYKNFFGNCLITNGG